MRRIMIVLALAAPLFLTPAYAQEVPGAGRIEVGAFPVGGVFFNHSSSGTEPSFGNFALGATFTFNMNRWVGFEGELGSAIGLDQQITFRDATGNRRSPGMWAYSGNVVFNPIGSDHRLVPYGAGGAGGTTLHESSDLGISATTTYFTGNLGGGLKWFAHRHWGIRADYRLLMVNDKPTAPEFFGRDGIRYGHRVYGGLLINY